MTMTSADLTLLLIHLRPPAEKVLAELRFTHHTESGMSKIELLTRLPMLRQEQIDDGLHQLLAYHLIHREKTAANTYEYSMRVVIR